MDKRQHSPRNRSAQADLPPHLRTPAFVWSKKGRCLYAVGGITPSIPANVVQPLYDDLSAAFGNGLARVVCNAVAFPPYVLPVLYSIGTRQRLNRLHQILDLHGRYVPGVGFQGFAHEPALVDCPCPQCLWNRTGGAS